MIAAKLPARPAARERGGEPAASNDLFRQIGGFLAEHRLSPEPGHYAFAFHVLRDPHGSLAEAVARLTDGGVRLSRQDIEALGGTVSSDAQPLEPEELDAQLAASTRVQVEGFAAMVREVHNEARGFGRDLAASAEAIRRSGNPMEIDDIVQLTAVMVERVRTSERRLERARAEVSALRARLEEAQGSARRDPLTDLPNRRALEEAFAALAPDAGACLAICDIDRFKQINDGFGHSVGDRVLTAIGRTLAEQCRPHFVARHGGEEFVVLATATPLAAERGMGDEAREAVGAKRFRTRDTDEPIGSITFSAGIGTVTAGESLDDALCRVDQALYQAKAQGRDRVVVVAKG